MVRGVGMQAGEEGRRWRGGGELEGVVGQRRERGRLYIEEWR